MRLIASGMVLAVTLQVMLSLVAPAGPIEMLQAMACVAVLMLIWLHRLTRPYDRAEVARGLAGDLLTIHLIVTAKRKGMVGMLAVDGETMVVRKDIRKLMDVANRVNRYRQDHGGSWVAGSGLRARMEHFSDEYVFGQRDVEDILDAIRANPDNVDLGLLLLRLIAISHKIERTSNGQNNGGRP